jgi:hypothetical protein
VLLVYSPYKSTEPRAIQAAERIFEELPFKGRVENLNYFLISDDPNISNWLISYFSDKQEGRIIISMSVDEIESHKGDGWFIRNKLSENFFGRDLFGYTLPLKEDTYFFGRHQIVANYIDSIKRSENKGIFGLRKTGKTSLIFKIQRTIQNEKIGLFFFYDCKSPSLRKLRWNELLGEICKNIAKRIGINIRREFDEININKTFRHVLKTAASFNKKIILVFDEIEYISFKSITDKHWHDDYIEFWQTMWAAQSLHRNLVYMIAGVNPTIIETDRVNGIQNPLFGIVQYEYLRGLSDTDLKNMIKTLGRRMGLNFDYEAIEYLQNWYGGHPLLSRLACSWINKESQIKKEKKPILITKKKLLEEQANRDSDLVFYCKHVVSELQDFYPDEYEMLELLSSGQTTDFIELSNLPEYIKHLKNYGLLEYDIRNVPKVAIPVIGRYVALELAKKENRKSLIKVIAKEKRDSWLEQRKMAIVRDIRQLERLIQSNSMPSLFGTNSFPEADEFVALSIVNTKHDFISFINVCNRCFVESIENYGVSIGDNKYFWNSIKQNYEGLFYGLERIKVYRNEQDHILLNNIANEKFLAYISEDLEGQKPSGVTDVYFVFQQRILDGLLTGILIESNKIG